MQPDEEQIEKFSKRYTQLSIVSFFLMALLQGLHSFFFTLFFWPAVGFGILAIYYRVAANRQEQASTAQWHQADSPASTFIPKRLILIVVSVAVITFIAIVGSMISSKNDGNSSATETEKTDEPESQESEKKSSEYDKAALEFNKQNYRQSISIAQRAFIRDSNNSDLMLMLGDDYGALKQYDSAFIWFDRAYQNGARSAYLSHWLGFLYDDKGSRSQALEFYKDALKQDSSRTEVYDRLAELEPENAMWYKKKSQQWRESK